MAAAYCRHGACGDDYKPTKSMFDLNNLEKELNPLEWWDTVLEKLSAIGKYCSVAVVIWLCYTSVTSFVTFIRLRFIDRYNTRDAYRLAYQPSSLHRDYVRGYTTVEDSAPLQERRARRRSGSQAPPRRGEIQPPGYADLRAKEREEDLLPPPAPESVAEYRDRV